MIHPSAVIDDNVKIGRGTSVWQFASLIRGAEVGEVCSIGGCSIVDAARIGDRCSVGHGAQLHPGLRAGNEVFFGPGCVICNDPWPRVRKGDFDMEELLHGFVTCTIGSGTSIGARAVVLPGTVIGEGAMVAAGSVVRRSVPDGHLHKANGEIVLIDRRPVTRMRRGEAT